MDPATDVPNLPHFRANKPKLRGKGGDFAYSSEHYFFEQIPQQQVLLDLHHKTASTSLQIRRGKEPSGESALLGASTGISTAGYIANSGLILKFEAYFKESVDESPLENHRVRKCRILLHLEDSSMKIDEYRQQNSGMLQGTLVKRHRIPYPEGRPGHYNVGDIAVGGTIDVYGRRFHVIDADLATRRFLKERLGRVEAPAIPSPTDRFTVERKEFMSRETGCDPTVRHGVVKNEMKAFAEALLGNTVDNSKRAGFIKYDRNVLCFQAVWDDRGRLYGDIRRFELHYFLEDDTIEIRSLRGPNSGRDRFPVMLRRGRIPKSFSAGDAGDVYHWKDFGIGTEVNVYERPLVLVDADAHTRQFYASNGISLGSPIPSEPTPEPEPEPEPPLLPPSVDSFSGSLDDEDMAPRSTSLVPSPARKIRGEDVMFRYTADLVSDILEDNGREFIITYYKEDRTITVREPPRKNSGVVGGTFLSRMKVRDVSGNVITEGCFYVGAEVTINKHLFRITGADDKTFRLMEERSASAFAFSDPVRAAEVISGWMDGRAGDLRTLLRERDTKGMGEASRAILCDVLESVGVRFSPTTPEQALITIMRAAGGDASSAPYESVVDRLEDPGGFQHGL